MTVNPVADYWQLYRLGWSGLVENTLYFGAQKRDPEDKPFYPAAEPLVSRQLK